MSARRHRPTSVHAQIPPGCRTPTPGWHRVLVRQHVDNRLRDMTEALSTLADKPWVSELRYLGVSRGWHVFELERKPDGASR